MIQLVDFHLVLKYSFIDCLDHKSQKCLFILTNNELIKDCNKLKYKCKSNLFTLKEIRGVNSLKGIQTILTKPFLLH